MRVNLSVAIVYMSGDFDWSDKQQGDLSLVGSDNTCLLLVDSDHVTSYWSWLAT